MWKKIKDNTLGITLNLFYGIEYSKFREWYLKRFPGEDLEDNNSIDGMAISVLYKGHNHFYMYVYDIKNIPLIVHETNHFSRKVLQTLDIEDEEMEVRYQEFWFKKLWKLK